MDYEGCRATAGFALADETAVETELVGGRHADAEDGRLAVHRDTARANPVFGLPS